MKRKIMGFVFILILICFTAYYCYFHELPYLTETNDLLIPPPSAFINTHKSYVATIQDEIPINNDIFKNNHSPKDTSKPSLVKPRTVPSSNTPKSPVPSKKAPRVIEDYNSITVLVNKNFVFPLGFVPQSLVPAGVPANRDGKLVHGQTAGPLKDMFEAAQQEGLSLILVSAYRSYQTQKIAYENAVKTYGETHANRYYAKPGHSEHQTGLAVDISSPSLNNRLGTDFGKTPEGLWLKENSWRFGFILRYPKGKEHITGYAYEPWHFRYLGIDLASEINQRAITLEEYFDVVD